MCAFFFQKPSNNFSNDYCEAKMFIIQGRPDKYNRKNQCLYLCVTNTFVHMYCIIVKVVLVPVRHEIKYLKIFCCILCQVFQSCNNYPSNNAKLGNELILIDTIRPVGYDHKINRRKTVSHSIRIIRIILVLIF